MMNFLFSSSRFTRDLRKSETGRSWLDTLVGLELLPIVASFVELLRTMEERDSTCLRTDLTLSSLSLMLFSNTSRSRFATC